MPAACQAPLRGGKIGARPRPGATYGVVAGHPVHLAPPEPVAVDALTPRLLPGPPAELERLRGFPEIGRDELARFFTLTPPDVAFVDPGWGRGPADRLGLAVALCTLPWLGFVPDDETTLSCVGAERGRYSRILPGTCGRWSPSEMPSVGDWLAISSAVRGPGVVAV